MKLEKLQFVVEDGVGIIAMNYMKNLNAIDDQMAYPPLSCFDKYIVSFFVQFVKSFDKIKGG